LTSIVTDSDIRRLLINSKENMNKDIKKIMNTNPIVIEDTMFLARALELMEEKRNYFL